MSTAQPLWADGEPEELALAFMKKTDERGKRLGRRSYIRLVAAIASASVHNAWAQAGPPGVDLVARVRNVMLTAQEVERLIASSFPPDGDDDDDDDDESVEDSSTSSSTSKLENGGQAIGETTEGLRATAVDEPPLRVLEMAVQDLLSAAAAASAAYASPKLSTDPHGCVAGPAAPPEHLSLPAASPPFPFPSHSPASASQPPSLLVLSDKVLDHILRLLDSRSAATAAATCRRLHAAHGQLRFFNLSPAFRAYLAALLALQYDDDGFADGSLESDFTANFPLDGSPSCGADLADYAFSRRMAIAMPKMEQLFMLLAAPGERSLQEFRSAIAHTEERRRPPPHPQSSPLASFMISMPVPLSVKVSDGGGNGGGSPGGRRRYLLRHQPPVRQQQQQPLQQQPPPQQQQQQPQMNLMEDDLLEGAPGTPPPTCPMVAVVTPLRQIPSIAAAATTLIGAADDPAADDTAGCCFTDAAALAPAADDSPAAATSGPQGTSTAWLTTSIAAAACGGGSVCCLANAMCDVQELLDIPASRMHCDGDLLVLASRAAVGGGGGSGARMRSPGAVLTALTLGRGAYPQYDRIARYGIGAGVPSTSGGFAATQLCADSANGLVWASSGEDGRLVRGFRAPVASLSLPLLAGSGSGSRGDSTALQYVLNCEVMGLGGRHAGLHVIGGTRLACVKSSGAVLFWDIASLQPCSSAVRVASAAVAGGLGGDSDKDDDMYDDVVFDDDDDDDDAELAEVRPPPLQRRRWGITTTAPAAVGGAASVHGVRAHSVSLLPLPSPLGSRPAAGLLMGLSREDAEDAAPAASDVLGGWSASRTNGPIRLTHLLYDDTAPTSPTLVAALGGNIIVSYDLETLRVKQQLFGHLYDITDIAGPPSAWQQPSLFATCARSGDVKVWDLRTSCGSAAVTLTGGETWQLNAVVLASAGGGAGGGCGGGGGGRVRLGAGMVCFAGGDGESIWSWDLRGGHARPMYELSTGNTQVLSLAWHERGNSLLASCKSPWENLRGVHNPQDWKQIRVGGGGGPSGAGGAAAAAGGGGRSGGPAVAHNSLSGGSGGGGIYSSACGCSNYSAGGAGGVSSSSAGGSSSGIGGGGGGSASIGAAAGGSLSRPVPLSSSSAGMMMTSGMIRGSKGGGGGDAMMRDGQGIAVGSGSEAAAATAATAAEDRQYYLHWPVCAKHLPDDFGAYFTMAHSCVLRYRFSEYGSRTVPQSSAPRF